MLEKVSHASCPYCGQAVDLLLDVSAGAESCIEDCPTCCRPINVLVEVDAAGALHVSVSRDDE